MKDKEITISKREYDKLKKDSEFLYCLKSLGVDNWGAYNDVRDLMEEK